MISILQRVKQARVEIDGQVAGSIGPGLLALVCAERGDTEAEADRLDGQGACGGLLIVSQFTLAADTGGGNRPSFTRAAPPADGERLYDYIVQRARALHPDVATGRFGADMQVHLLNDGPVTIPLSIAPAAAA
jgi:D-tyrosyl-tRNA(Tyr) deacylase